MGQTDGLSHGSRFHWQTEANFLPHYARNDPPPQNWQFQTGWDEQRTCNQPLGCHPNYPQRMNQTMNQQTFYNLSWISMNCSQIRYDYKYATTSQDQSYPETYPNHLGLGHGQRPYDGRLALAEGEWSPPPIIDNVEELLPPGYYRELDDDGEYHLYPVEDGNWERQCQLNEQFGLALQAIALGMGTLCKFQPQLTKEKNGHSKSTSSSQNLMKVKYSRGDLKKDNVTDSDVSKQIVFNTSINESGIPGVVPGNTCELENRNFYHTQSIKPEPRNPQNPSKKEKVMCHAKTSDGEISTEECGIMEDLEHISEGARRVVESVSLVRASTLFVQTAESIIVCLDPCYSGINTL